VGCKDKSARHDEAVKSIEAADRKLMVQEQALLGRRGALQRERTQIHDQRAALISRKMELGETDTKAHAELEREESKLATVEASIVRQQISLNQKYQSLLDEKSVLWRSWPRTGYRWTRAGGGSP